MHYRYCSPEDPDNSSCTFTRYIQCVAILFFNFGYSSTSFLLKIASSKFPTGLRDLNQSRWIWTGITWLVNVFCLHSYYFIRYDITCCIACEFITRASNRTFLYIYLVIFVPSEISWEFADRFLEISIRVSYTPSPYFTLKIFNQ